MIAVPRQSINMELPWDVWAAFGLSRLSPALDQLASHHSQIGGSAL